jgi:hypothetical protein
MMKAGGVLLVLSLAYFLSAGMVTATPVLTHHAASGPDWERQMVAGPAPTAMFGDLTLDQDSHPHLTYMILPDPATGDGQMLTYAQRTGETWISQPVTDAAWSTYSALALDDAGLPHIVYHTGDAAGHAIMYSHWTGSAWAAQRIDSSSDAGLALALALDSSGRPHVAYFGPPSAGLTYARWTGSAWERGAVDPTAQYSLDMALDSAGNPHIAYYDGLNQDLRYARWSGSAWDIQTVDHAGNVGGYASLALDSAGRPQISYHDADHWRLKYAQWTGGAWDIQTITGAGDGWGTSLALDADDNPHIGYVHLGAHQVRHAQRMGGAWVFQVVDHAPPISWQVALALDAAGYPHLGYGEYWESATVKYAYALPPLTLDKQAAPGAGVQAGATVTYTLMLAGAGANAELWDPLPDAVSYVDGTLTGTVTPAAVYSPTAHAVLWAGVLPTDTVQTVQFQTTVISTTEDLSPPAAIVNTAWLTDAMHSRSVTATFIVNARRAYLPVLLRPE